MMQWKVICYIKHKKMQYGLSLRKDGNMKLGIEGTEMNRKEYLHKQGLDDKVCYEPYVVHGTDIIVVNENLDSNIHYEVDGFVTSLKNVVLTVTVGDCFAVYMYDPVTKVIGIAHAGWRGVVNGIVSNLIRVAMQKYGSKPRDMVVALSPGIQQCHFVVKNDVIEQFELYEKFVRQQNNEEYSIHLPGIIKKQLHDLGVAQFEQHLDCTYCDDGKYFSYRRDKPENVEAMLAWIGWE